MYNETQTKKPNKWMNEWAIKASITGAKKKVENYMRKSETN
jgi:hypothetical protein